MNAVRREALALLGRTDDDLTDAEIFAQSATDEFWFISLAIDQFGRLPSELDRILTCREYTLLQAHSIVKKAMTGLIKTFGQN